MMYEQIERDCATLRQKVNSLSGQLNDLTPVELLGAEKTFRLVRRLVNFRPSKIADVRLHGPRRLDWQVCDSELEAHRGFLRVDDDYVRVLTLKELPGETRPLLLNGLAVQGTLGTPNDPPKVLAGISICPNRNMTVPASSEMVDQLGLRKGIRIIAADLSGL